MALRHHSRRSFRHSRRHSRLALVASSLLARRRFIAWTHRASSSMGSAHLADAAGSSLRARPRHHCHAGHPCSDSESLDPRRSILLALLPWLGVLAQCSLARAPLLNGIPATGIPSTNSAPVRRFTAAVRRSPPLTIVSDSLILPAHAHSRRGRSLSNVVSNVPVPDAPVQEDRLSATSDEVSGDRLLTTGSAGRILPLMPEALPRLPRPPRVRNANQRASMRTQQHAMTNVVTEYLATGKASTVVSRGALLRNGGTAFAPYFGKVA